MERVSRPGALFRLSAGGECRHSDDEHGRPCSLVGVADGDDPRRWRAPSALAVTSTHPCGGAGYVGRLSGGGFERAAGPSRSETCFARLQPVWRRTRAIQPVKRYHARPNAPELLERSALEEQSVRSRASRDARTDQAVVSSQARLVRKQQRGAPWTGCRPWRPPGHRITARRWAKGTGAPLA